MGKMGLICQKLREKLHDEVLQGVLCQPQCCNANPNGNAFVRPPVAPPEGQLSSFELCICIPMALDLVARQKEGSYDNTRATLSYYIRTVCNGAGPI